MNALMPPQKIILTLAWIQRFRPGAHYSPRPILEEAEASVSRE